MTTNSTGANGGSSAHDLFALTDEQILEIEPQSEEATNEWRVASEKSRAGAPTSLPAAHNRSVILSEPQASEGSQPSLSRGSSDDEILRDPANASLRMTPQPPRTDHGTQATGPEAQPQMAVPQEPPAWLAAQMKDPWTGEQARELWNGVQQAQQEAAAYRAAFATPHDAQALKDLYPGGVNEARATAERAKFLDDIDRAYFGAAGNSAEQTSAARARLAQTLLREDPAAFREMVFAGLRALEEAEKGSALAPNAAHLPRLAQVANRATANLAPSLRAASPSSPAGASETTRSAALTPGPTPVAQAFRPEALSLPAPASSLDAKNLTPEGVTYCAYAAFEKAANDDLERSVGAAIAHTIQKALPNLKASNEGTGVGARHASSAPEARLAPIQARLTAAVRQDVESALKGDRQLGEQIAQILSARRFDNETRALVVRLIDERARQLIPGAAKRVLNDWTQTTLAAHRAKGERADAAAARREVAPASPVPRGPSAGGDSSRTPQAYANSAGHRGARGDRSAITPRIDYRKLSDEQILEL